MVSAIALSEKQNRRIGCRTMMNAVCLFQSAACKMRKPEEAADAKGLSHFSNQLMLACVTLSEKMAYESEVRLEGEEARAVGRLEEELLAHAGEALSGFGLWDLLAHSFECWLRPMERRHSAFLFRAAVTLAWEVILGGEQLWQTNLELLPFTLLFIVASDFGRLCVSSIHKKSFAKLVRDVLGQSKFDLGLVESNAKALLSAAVAFRESKSLAALRTPIYVFLWDSLEDYS